MEDRKSWAIQDEAILGDLLALMNVTDEEKQILGEVKDIAQASAAAMVEAFYERLLVYENTAEYLKDKVEHLRGPLENWFVQLFSGEYTENYVNQRLAIGKTHVRIGLPVRYPLAMMDILMVYGEKVASQSSEPTLTINAFRKLAALDIAIFNQAYENTQLQHLSEMVGNERLARRLLSKGN